MGVDREPLSGADDAFIRDLFEVKTALWVSVPLNQAEVD
jgi:hypothetical protein